MRRLVGTTGCPTIDAELAMYTDVVLRSDPDCAVVLRYSPGFRAWYACACPSVNAAETLEIPDPDMYWKGIGYVEDAAVAYAIFESKPFRSWRKWNTFYNRVATIPSLRLMRD